MESLNPGGTAKTDVNITPHRSSTSHMKVSWRTFALVCALIAMGLLVALVTTMTSVGADSLAATALTLAVIAFGAQLVVYIAQAADSSSMRHQASEVNADTRASLARIGTTVANSDALLRHQYGKLLSELITSLRQEGIRSKESDDPLDFGDAVEFLESEAVRLRTSDQTESETRANTEIQNQTPQPASEISKTDHDATDLDAWPRKEEMKEVASVYQIMQTLDPLAIGVILRFALDIKTSEQLGLGPGLVYAGKEDAPLTASLIEAGLVQETGQHPKISSWMGRGDPVFATLTDKGRLAARLMMARGTAPWHMRQFVQQAVTQ